MKIKLVRNNQTTANTFEPIKNIGQSVQLAALTEDYQSGETITSIAVSATGFDMKQRDRININGQLLTLSANASAGATSLSVNSTVLDYYLENHASIKIDYNNLFVQYQRKTEGQVAGFDIDDDGFTKGGIEITSFLDDDTMEFASATSLATSESIKAYVGSKAPRNYMFATSSGTGLTSATDGLANAVVVPFDTSAVDSSGTIALNGSSGIATVAGSEYSFTLDTNTNTGVYEIRWNVSVNTSVANNRYLCGVTLETAIATPSTTVTWTEVSPSRTWIYNRGTGNNRYASGANSIVYNLTTETAKRIFRVVFWKEDGQASGKLITTTNGCSVTIKQL